MEELLCGRCNKPKGDDDGCCNCGRPTKLTEQFLAAADQVFATDDVVFFTDAELLAEINERLPEEDRISQSTFERWKAGDTEDSRGAEFRGLIEKALRREKRSLFERLKSRDDTQWTRWAWIIERKFDEWNLKRKVEQDTTIHDPAQKLIGAMMGAETSDEPDTLPG